MQNEEICIHNARSEEVVGTCHISKNSKTVFADSVFLVGHIFGNIFQRIKLNNIVQVTREEVRGSRRVWK